MNPVIIGLGILLTGVIVLLIGAFGSFSWIQFIIGVLIAGTGAFALAAAKIKDSVLARLPKSSGASTSVHDRRRLARPEDVETINPGRPKLEMPSLRYRETDGGWCEPMEATAYTDTR